MLEPKAALHAINPNLSVKNQDSSSNNIEELGYTATQLWDASRIVLATEQHPVALINSEQSQERKELVNTPMLVSIF